MSTAVVQAKTYVLAEFPTGEALVAAAYKAREKGLLEVDTYSPYPLHGGDEALGLGRSKVPLIALGGGLAGMFGGFGMMAYMNGLSWPLNVGGRPPIATPAFIPITFETTVLVASLSIFFGLMALMRLPQPYHPAFDVEAFRSAANDGFWLSAVAPSSDSSAVVRELEAMGGKNVSAVVEQTA